jgi:cold-inducible RNA-binding protein
MGKRLYIGNISFRATEENVRDLFAGIGTVASINLVTDARTGKAKGVAFVEMATVEEALMAIESLNGVVLLGRSLTVSMANTQQTRERRDLDRDSGVSGKGK